MVIIDEGLLLGDGAKTGDQESVKGSDGGFEDLRYEDLR